MFRFADMRILAALLLSFALGAQAQSTEENALTASLSIGAALPTDLLSTRSVVLFQNAVTKADLEETQKYFQQTGIDAVCYFDIDYVLGGVDTRRAFANYFSFRNIKYIIVIQKKNGEYTYYIGSYCGSRDIFDKTSQGWKQSNSSQVELLRTIYRFATSNLKRQNFLINDLPEMDIAMNYFTGRINQNFSVEAKSFKMAVPKMESERDNLELEAFMKQYYPFKFEMVDATMEEAELLARGFRTVLRVLHTRGAIAREILGYDPTQTGRSLATTFFADGVTQIKTIPSQEPVYKFYVKSTEYGNLFLGNKWDAEVRWQDALRNYVMAVRADAKIN